MKRRIVCLLFFCMAMLTTLSAQKQDCPINGQIQRLWHHPTSDYLMKTWWFFGYEHTTDEGITADVEALQTEGLPSSIPTAELPKMKFTTWPT